MSVYNYQGRCATLIIIPNGTSVCIICEESDNIKNGLIKRPKYEKKKYPYKNVILYWLILLGTWSTNVK